MLQRFPSASRLEFDTLKPSAGHRALLGAIADLKHRKTLDNADDANKQ